MAEHLKDPGVAVLLGGDGGGQEEEGGFLGALKNMYRLGWRVQVLSLLPTQWPPERRRK